MKMSKRAKRMERHHKRGKGAGLNMISLMDIFTILVFFLLVNSSTGEVLPSTKSIKLPESIAEELPRENIVIVVNDQSVVVQGKKVADVQQVMASRGSVIEGLKAELDLLAGERARPVIEGMPFIGEVTIMADKEIPYMLLKRIMVTCTKARYGNISLAVNRRVEKG